ncbi:unnamed protein product, partial [Staurois parvus]
SVEGPNLARLDPWEPGPEGLRSPQSVVHLAPVADGSESPEAVKIDGSPEDLKGLAEGPPVVNGRMRLYGQKETEYSSEVPGEKAHYVLRRTE